MKKIRHLYLIVIVCFSTSIEAHAQEITQNDFLEVADSDLCGNWSLNKITKTSEKTIVAYDGSQTKLMFECEKFDFQLIEMDEVVSQGKWILTNQNIELKTAESTINVTITYLSSRKLVITIADEIREYSRK